MKRQAGPREQESRGAWGPGEKPSVSERQARGRRVGVLTGGEEEKEGERATKRSEGGVGNLQKVQEASRGVLASKEQRDRPMNLL